MIKQNNNTELGMDGKGRLPEKERKQEAPSSSRQDISSVDRQEGDMDNGELGGNFGTLRQEEGEKENKP